MWLVGRDHYFAIFSAVWTSDQTLSVRKFGRAAMRTVFVNPERFLTLAAALADYLGVDIDWRCQRLTVASHSRLRGRANVMDSPLKSK